MERAPERVAADLLQLEASGQKALYQVRNILFDLRPVILESQGLGPALRGYAERLRSLEPFNLELDIRFKARLKPHIEGLVFSIVQEAVNNAKKHAAPRNVWIRAVEASGWLAVTVRDDGSGFQVPEVQQSLAARNSFGLLNMRERAEVAGARLEIESTPGKGTRITLKVPLSAQNIDRAERDI
jgi:signal transduction histidine kinase